MRKAVFDFETRSKIPLSGTKGVGAWKYSTHPSTEILCLGVKTKYSEYIWFPDKFKPSRKFSNRLTDENLNNLIENIDVFEAHNAFFEKCIWENILTPKHGIKLPSENKWRCTAALAAYHSLPRKLEEVNKALGLKEQKDKKGSRLCLNMCKPRTPRKAEKQGLSLFDVESLTLWHEEPEQLSDLFDYCIQDVRAEWDLAEFLGDLPDSEQRIWLKDQEINKRGVYIDLPAIESLKKSVDENKNEIEFQFQNKVGFSPSQVGELKDWIISRGHMIEGVSKGILNDLLTCDGLDPLLKEIVGLRLKYASASVSKIEKMLLKADIDRRIRDSFLYYGCSTGRWSGMGIQPQNFPRAAAEDMELIIQLAEMGGMKAIKAVTGMDSLTAAKKCLRGLLTAGPGKELIAGDLSAIEGRVLAWLAGEDHIIDHYKNGLDVYKTSASAIYNVSYENITKDQRQIGKVCELALGYQGWIGAFLSMAEIYGVDIPEELQKDIILAWRKNRPATTRLWDMCEQAVILAIENPGKIYKYRSLAFLVRDNFLRIKLPSGRVLFYFNPEVSLGITPWGAEKKSISYWGRDSKKQGKWSKLYTYGGKLVENIVQALARDVIAFGIFKVEEKGYPVVLHVHDEIVSEVDKGTGDLNEFLELMSITPDWAEGLPLAAGGWRGKRYRKD